MAVGKMFSRRGVREMRPLTIGTSGGVTVERNDGIKVFIPQQALTKQGVIPQSVQAKIRVLTIENAMNLYKNHGIIFDVEDALS